MKIETFLHNSELLHHNIIGVSREYPGLVNLLCASTLTGLVITRSDPITALK